MLQTKDVQAVLEHLTQLKMPIAKEEDRAAFTPQVIGRFYDQYLSSLSKEQMPKQFMNYGYWAHDTFDSATAQANLMDKLISRVSARTGRILDVACGTGATTGHISKHWNEGQVFGINISQSQLSIYRRELRSNNVAVMDAARMTFAENSFEAVVCVEAAFHFDTREMFLKQCYKVLKRDGVLALTDVLLHKDGHALLPMWPSCNFLPALVDYRTLLLDIGFSQAEVIDITDIGWRAFARQRLASLHDNWLSGRCNFARLQRDVAEMYRLAAAIRFNVMCFAVK